MEERVRFEAKFVPGKHDVAMKYFAKQLEEKKGKTKADILQDLCVKLNELRNELDSMQFLRESIIADIKKS